MTSSNNSAQFDAVTKESQLRTESESWDTSDPEPAKSGDIPVLNVRQYLESGNSSELRSLAEQLRYASTHVGFYSLTGHDIPITLITEMFEAARRFHDLPLDTKLALEMDRPDWPVKSAGYLPLMNRKLPARKKGNANEAYVVKREHGPRNITMNDNQWPTDVVLPGFRQTVEAYADAVEKLALRLLPIYAAALDIEPNFFDEGFASPVFRLRMSRYPPVTDRGEQEFGIAPHVDTTFFTILAQDSEGLVIYSEQRQRWIQAPMLDNAFIVNTGELLRQWTNDRFISVKHFANNNYSSDDRYSIPFFFNATSDYRMECIPTCCGADNPARYPPVSYLESQGVVQGE